MEKTIYTVTLYYGWTHKVAYHGLVEDARKWLLDQAFTFEDGRKIYRTWQENNANFYDVGPVYYSLEKIL